jgi:hypothetical protein
VIYLTPSFSPDRRNDRRIDHPLKGEAGEYEFQAEKITDPRSQEKVMAAFQAKYDFRGVISGVIRLGQHRIFRFLE